jgi:hypothetical protein
VSQPLKADALAQLHERATAHAAQMMALSQASAAAGPPAEATAVATASETHP